MAVSLRLSRGGSKKRPYYKIVVANSRAPRDGKFLEQVGTYNPLLAKDDENRVRLVEDRVRYWLGVGAQATDRVARLLDKAGIKERAATNNPNKGEPGQKAKDRAEDKAAKAAEAAEAAAEANRAAAIAARGAITVENVEWYVLARLAAQRSLSFVGSVPLLIDDAFVDWPVSSLGDVLTRIERMSEVIQILYVTDDTEIIDWARHLGNDRARVVGV